MKRLVFQSYPNNEIRIGWDDIPYPRRTGGDLSRQREMEHRGEQHDARRKQWLSDNNIIEWRDSNGTLYRSRQEDGNYICNDVRSDLVITSELQEHPPRREGRTKEDYSKPIERTRFTRNARHRLLEAGSICEERRGTGLKGVFVTFTLPGSCFPAYVALAQYSGFVANRLCQCIRDYKWSESYFWVWERQKRGALHMHLFILLREGTELDCYREPLRLSWYSALRDVGESSGADMFRHKDGMYCTASHHWRYDYQEVRKGVANYLSKYVSKNAECGFSEGLEDGDAGIFPRRWWYMSRDLTQEINRRRKVICAEGLRNVDVESITYCMDAMATSLEPRLQHSYDADIGRTKYRDGCFGHSFRRIYWFDSTDFADIELALRTQFLSLIADIQKSRITFKGFALDYGGERLPIPGG